MKREGTTVVSNHTQARTNRLCRAVIWVLILGSLVGCTGRPVDGSPRDASKRRQEQTGEQEHENWVGGMKAENDRERNGKPMAETEAGDGEEQLAGSVQLAGSSSMEEYGDALAESFMEKYPDVTVAVQFTGSGAGIEAVASGRADVGNSSRNLTDEEKDSGLVENIVALDGIAVCVDSANPLTNITRQQLADIYTGAITNWSVVGGTDLPIVVVGREAGSGTREAFESLLHISGRCTYANELDSTGAIMARVASTPGAIGYLSFDAVQSAISPLSLDDVSPTMENVKAGAYPLYHPFVMVTRGEISAQNVLVQTWFDYVYSAEGQDIAEKVGVIGTGRAAVVE